MVQPSLDATMLMVVTLSPALKGRAKFKPPLRGEDQGRIP
jgi:hypothetical protein